VERGFPAATRDGSQWRWTPTAAVPVPAGVDLKVAAAAILQGLTAHYLSHTAFPIKPGQVAVVHAAAGGVGLLLTQMNQGLGGTVVATTSSTAKALARQAGRRRLRDHLRRVPRGRPPGQRRPRRPTSSSTGWARPPSTLAWPTLRPRGMMCCSAGRAARCPVRSATAEQRAAPSS